MKKVSSDRYSDRRPNLAKVSELPQQSYISRKRVGRFRHFSSFFVAWFPCIYFTFKYFYRFTRHRRTYYKNPRVKISNIEVFMGLRNMPKWTKSRCRMCFSFFFFFLSSQGIFFSSRQFPRFLNTF